LKEKIMASRIEIELAHELDASWIIALYLAIHGGDPPPNEQNVRINEAIIQKVAELAAQFRETGALRNAPPLTLAMLQERMKSFGVEVVQGEKIEAESLGDPEGPQRPPLPWCFVFRGQRICVERPRVTHRVQ
jgi:hypothetical protein